MHLEVSASNVPSHGLFLFFYSRHSFFSLIFDFNKLLFMFQLSNIGSRLTLKISEFNIQLFTDFSNVVTLLFNVLIVEFCSVILESFIKTGHCEVSSSILVPLSIFHFLTWIALVMKSMNISTSAAFHHVATYW